MTADKPSALVPKLRFPKFKGEAAWSARILTNVVRSISSGLNLTQTNGSNGFRVTRIETIADGTIDINKVGFVTTDQDISSYRLNIGNILLSNINSITHIGKSVLIDRDYDLYHGMNLLRLEAFSAVIHPLFLFYWLNTEITRTSIRSRANKAVNQASINQTELGNTIVLFPLLSEQQKIADCLGSLDDLIAAKGRKLEALRQHKQGLMQQLFPQPGESVPKLRFPEFQEAPAWFIEPLGCLFPERNETGFSELPLLSVTDREGVVPQEETNRKITANANRAKYLRVVPRDIVYNTMRMWEGRSARVSMEGVVSPAYTVCRPSDEVNSYFFAYYFKTWSLIAQFRKYSQGLVKDTLSLKYGAFSLIPVGFPPPNEQQKIADCLGSLDDLIAAEGRKLDALRQHKQGLMQKLFPSLDGQ